MTKKLTIQAMQELAESRGGKCLSDVYVNANSKLTWRCAKGHQWTATPGNVQSGSWCPICAGFGKTIEDVRHLAAERGGECLSPAFIGARTPLLWQCVEGHRWKATPDNIRRGEWCPFCARRVKLTIQEMQRLAESGGGKCLSDTYVTSGTPLLWECREGHRWKARPNSVKKGTWCPVCAGKSKPSISDMQRVAGERGGRLLSRNYRNAKAHLEWECNDGHRWKATWDKTKQGQWCPECSTGLGERICREFFSQLFQSPFPKGRPKWLINRGGNQMELDGYCANLGMAFEHQGRQHYDTQAHFFTMSGSELLQRQEDDTRKSNLCAQRGITLVSVPEIPTLLPLDQVRAFIKEQLAAKRIPLPQDFDTRDIDINRAYRTSGSREVLDHLRTIAAEHGGQCLSPHYVNDDTNLLWQCAQGHKWEADPGHIKQGTWCPFCAGRGKTIQDMQQLATQKGGQCLSPAHLGALTHLMWQCARGHKWDATPSEIRQGHWCPYCAGMGKTTEDMQRLAVAKGGRCLSDEYINAKTHLLWRCKEGHEWKATPSNIERGKWCPKCAQSRLGHAQRLGLPQMQVIAASRGGRCLSDEYIDNQTHLLWECKDGHQWRAIPMSVKKGHWCPVCGHRRAWERRRARQTSTSGLR